MERRKVLSLLGLTTNIKNKDVYILLLREKESELRIPIVIGSAEAQAIIIASSNVKPPRPLSHDLFSEIMLGYGIEIREVYINKVEDHIFHAEICCDRYGTTLRFDSRASDAIALALRFNAPIYTNDEVLRNAGIPPSAAPNLPNNDPIVLLKKKLDEAIQKEDYENAARLRDEIRRLEE
ncbi:MAG: DUF151 domain-containing protein [Paludibacteraceae bacterium]|nr:DUF151 domain-containing protein [Paludibacteraceae bacterium]